MTTLAAIEACPRQWALRAADYPELWSGRGYPPRTHLGALAGSVVHIALESITTALVRARCPSLQDPAAVEVMKGLGGITKVLDDSIERSLEQFAVNPRARHMIDAARGTLRGRLPELRTKVQAALCRRNLPQPLLTQFSGDVPAPRRPLTHGVYSEVDLAAQKIGWRGRADLLVVSPEHCEIIDFKTSVPDGKHAFQVQVYALLWNRDTSLNPNGRRADRLVISYSSGDVEVPPPAESELDTIEAQLVARSAAAREAASQDPPLAKPCPENCRYCDVRHMCTEYWSDETLSRMGRPDELRHFLDMEICITGRHGPTSWDARIERCGTAARGQALLLRVAERSVQLRPGQRVRVLSIYVSAPSEDEDTGGAAVGTIGANSEVFSVV